jgi:hypothetical protein
LLENDHAQWGSFVHINIKIRWKKCCEDEELSRKHRFFLRIISARIANSDGFLLFWLKTEIVLNFADFLLSQQNGKTFANNTEYLLRCAF